MSGTPSGRAPPLTTSPARPRRPLAALPSRPLPLVVGRSPWPGKKTGGMVDSRTAPEVLRDVTRALRRSRGRTTGSRSAAGRPPGANPAARGALAIDQRTPRGRQPEFVAGGRSPPVAGVRSWCRSLEVGAGGPGACGQQVHPRAIGTDLLMCRSPPPPAAAGRGPVRAHRRNRWSCSRVPGRGVPRGGRVRALPGRRSRRRPRHLPFGNGRVFRAPARHQQAPAPPCSHHVYRRMLGIAGLGCWTASEHVQRLKTAAVRGEALRAFADLGTALIGARDTGEVLDAVIADGPGWGASATWSPRRLRSRTRPCRIR